MAYQWSLLVSDASNINYMNKNEIKIKFLEESIRLNHNLRNAIDYKANFLLAMSGAVLLFSFTLNDTYFSILAGFATIASIVAIGYPFTHRTKSSNLCWWGIKKTNNFENYKKNIDKINSEAELINEYEKEIFSLYQNSIRPKLFSVRVATFSLLIIILLGIIKLV